MLGEWSYLNSANRVDFNRLINVCGMGESMHVKFNWNFFNRRMNYVEERDLKNVIISSELLFWLNSYDDIKDLAQRLSKIFDIIEVVVYLRRQDQVALSHRKQVVLGQAAYQFYGAQLQALPQWRSHMLKYFDYGSKLLKWKQCFGENNVIIRRFQSDDLYGGDTVTDFWKFLKIGQPIKIPRKNEAWSCGQIKAGLWLRRRGYPRNAFVPILKEMKDPTPLLPSRSEAIDFLRNLNNQNKRLAHILNEPVSERYFNMKMPEYNEVGTWDQGLKVDLMELEEKVRMSMNHLKLVKCNPGDI
jgi:hypothetical protein